MDVSGTMRVTGRRIARKAKRRAGRHFHKRRAYGAKLGGQDVLLGEDELGLWSVFRPSKWANAAKDAGHVIASGGRVVRDVAKGYAKSGALPFGLASGLKSTSDGSAIPSAIDPTYQTPPWYAGPTGAVFPAPPAAASADAGFLGLGDKAPYILGGGALLLILVLQQRRAA